MDKPTRGSLVFVASSNEGAKSEPAHVLSVDNEAQDNGGWVCNVKTLTEGITRTVTVHPNADAARSNFNPMNDAPWLAYADDDNTPDDDESVPVPRAKRTPKPPAA